MKPLCVFLAAFALAIPTLADEADERSIETIRHPEELQLSLWADSTQLANPVAFTFDEQGRMYICETFRQNKGVEDNRSHMDWLDDDLAAQTVEDRLAYFRKHLSNDLSSYEAEEDRITVVSDEDGDGRADKYWTYADGFKSALTGTGAGVLVRGQDVYYTCIPHLWKLSDTDGDGIADQRDSLHYGYGVRVAFRGHDSHGLVMGPDGRIYFSIGDRGYHIKTSDGRTLKDPESGAVFRCELDGSQLEVFATGLRNPQELVFNDVGDLFTGENNSDSGDRARLVHVVEGSDAGWRMAFQYLPDRGPWNREQLWHPPHAGQSAFIVPPIANFADGPSGLTYYPGTGLGKDYQGTFFLCDFRGDAAMSGVRSFQLEPHGASYAIKQPEQFLWNVLATDVDFGPDGGLYITDWIEGWEGVNRGRVVRVTNPAVADSVQVKNVRKLLAEDMAEHKLAALRRRLGHADRRVRMKAQFELARRGAVRQLTNSAVAETSRPLARLHATWGLGQVARTAESSRKQNRAKQALAELVRDDDAAVRVAAMAALADADAGNADEQLVQALQDNHPRVQVHAALAIGKRKITEGLAPLLTMISANQDRDAVLRHAAVMGLVGAARPSQLAELSKDSRRAVRLAAVLALRRQLAPDVATFLEDRDPLVVVEAARAIHDVPIMAALPKLARALDQANDDEALLRRALNANYRLGQPPHAAALARYVARGDALEAMQLEALEMLSQWATPSSRDRVLGMWRPLTPRSKAAAVTAVKGLLPQLHTVPNAVSVAAARVASELGVAEAATVLHRMVLDAQYPPSDRAALLQALSNLNYAELEAVVVAALEDTAPAVRSVARQLLVPFDEARALQELSEAVAANHTLERQSAFATLARMEDPASETLLVKVVKEDLVTGRLQADSQLDLVAAARTRGGAAAAALQPFLQQLMSKPYGEHQLTLAGGSAERGEQLFHENVSLSCLRCHRVGEEGGRVGPNLAGIGKLKSPEYLLEAIVDPNKQIAEGFGTVVLVTEDGLQHQGIVQKELIDLLLLVDANGNRFHVVKDEIIVRQDGKSAMPEDLIKFMTPFQLRDLVAYLRDLQTPWVEATGGHEE